MGIVITTCNMEAKSWVNNDDEDNTKDSVNNSGEAKQRKDDYDDPSMDGMRGRPSSRVNTGWGENEAGDEAKYEQSVDAAGDTPNAVPVKSKRTSRREAAARSKMGRPSNNHFGDDDDDGDDIMEIPDLEEEVDEEPDLTTKIAEAPRNLTRKVPTLTELNANNQSDLPRGSKHQVDLAILTSALCPRMVVAENEAEPWDFDSLLQSVSREIRIEKETKMKYGNHENLDSTESEERPERR